jgi:triacylglycerol lipase
METPDLTARLLATATPTFDFTQLVEPASAVDPSGFPAGFDPAFGLLLAQCCSLTYVQFQRDPKTAPPPFTPQELATALTALGPDYTYQQVGPGFTAPERQGLGTSLAAGTTYATVPFGFALRAAKGGQPAFNVLAFRGTQTLDEWLGDATALPTKFALDAASPNPGYVHLGFYNQYTLGTGGTGPSSGNPRPAGSLAAAVAAAMPALAAAAGAALPLYVTGHSLGAALAVLCAMDVAVNFAADVAGGGSELTMTNFAGPRVSAGSVVDGITVFDVQQFVDNYQSRVPDSFRVVNAADLVPILPPPSLTVSAIKTSLLFEHVTSDPINYCAQLQTIGNNHSLDDNYLPYATAAAAGFRG